MSDPNVPKWLPDGVALWTDAWDKTKQVVASEVDGVFEYKEIANFWDIVKEVAVAIKWVYTTNIVCDIEDCIDAYRG